MYDDNDEIQRTAAINDTQIYIYYKSKPNRHINTKRKKKFSQNILQKITACCTPK